MMELSEERVLAEQLKEAANGLLQVSVSAEDIRLFLDVIVSSRGKVLRNPVLEEMLALSEERVLAEQLKEAAKGLHQVPVSAEDVRLFLDQVESCLLRVKQSPSLLVQSALCPTMKALLTDNLLRHPDLDIQTSMALCVSEITRITAPNVPYNDKQMKDIFVLIVSTFERLSDTSSPSYPKRVSVLEIMAQVRSCLVMLDLECDALILEMFQHFLETIRNDHPNHVFSSMETIMTLVLDQSEDISLELLYPLLRSLKKENQSVLPIARKLVEQVFENCASKVKPYMIQAVHSMGMSVDNYSKIVPFICQGIVDITDHRFSNGSRVHTLPKHIGPEAVCPDASQKSIGVRITGLIDSVKRWSFPMNKSDQVSVTPKSAQSELDYVGVSLMELGTTRGQASKRKRDQKMTPSVDSLEFSGHPLKDGDKEALQRPSTRRRPSMEANDSHIKSLSSEEGNVPLNHDETNQLCSQTELQNETLSSASPPSCQALHVKPPPKVDQWSKTKGNTNQDEDTRLPSVPGGALLSDQRECDLPSSADVSKRISAEKSFSVGNPCNHLGETALAMKPSKQETPSFKVTSDKESVAASGSEAKPRRQSSKKMDASFMYEDQPSVVTLKGKHKRGRKKAIPAGALLSNRSEGNLPSSTDVLKSTSVRKSFSDGKPCNHLGATGLGVNPSEHETPSCEVTSKKESVAASGSEAKPRRQSSKKLDTSFIYEDQPSEIMLTGKSKKGRKKAIIGKEVVGEEFTDKKKVSSSKSITESPNEDQNHLVKSPKTSTKRKHTPAKGQVSIGTHPIEDFGENVVGLQVKVWWPMDKTFYEGIIDSFDPVKKKHKVSYIDGEVEILNLKKQRWEVVGGDSVPNKAKATNPPTSCAVLDMKKVKEEPASPIRQDTAGASVRREEGTSGGKSTAKTGRKRGRPPKNANPDMSSKSKHNRGDVTKKGIPKNSTKRVDDRTPSFKIKEEMTDIAVPETLQVDTSTMANCGTPQVDTSTMANCETLQVDTGNMTNCETPQIGSMASGSGTSSKGKAGKSYAEEYSDGLEPPVSRENDAKGSKDGREKFSGQ